MRNFIALKVDLGSDYVSLSATSVVATFTLMVPSSSSQDATVQGTDGKELAIAPGSQFAFERVDLSQIKVKSKPGECVYVIGHSG